MDKPTERSAKKRLNILMRDRNRRIRLLVDKGLIVDESDVPEDAIPIDPNVSTKSLTLLPTPYYEDIYYVCSDCGNNEVWRAESQQNYFELKSANPHKLAKRCFDCRQLEVARREQARRDAGHA